MITIFTNAASLAAQRNLLKSGEAATSAIARLSSGLRINGAQDDAAGLGMVERMTSQLRGQEQAIRNANDAISWIQTAEGSLANVTASAQRARELALQASTGLTITEEDRDRIAVEFYAVLDDIKGLMEKSSYNGLSILKGPSAGQLSVQIGAQSDDKLLLNFKAADGEAIGDSSAYNDIVFNGLGGAIQVEGPTESNAQAAIGPLDIFIGQVLNVRTQFGAALNRLDSVIGGLQTNNAAVGASRGRIVDADFAKESSALARSQILQQAGNTMLAQANQIPQGALSLLGKGGG